MDDAREIVAAGAPSGSLVVADFQSGGRGRFRDRSWLGERGRDLLFTICLKLDLVQASAFPLKVGLAVCRAIEACPDIHGLGLQPRLKWPNDIFIHDRKACGILCESASSWYYAGVGINCGAREFPPGLRHPATSLEAELGRPLTPLSLLEALIAQLKGVFESTDWISQIEERLYRKGDRIRFLDGLPEQGRVIEGVLHGLGPGGELLIDVEGMATQRFVSGEII